jgi:hypothetical protein
MVLGFGWGAWIRTTTGGSKDRCPAFRRHPNKSRCRLKRSLYSLWKTPPPVKRYPSYRSYQGGVPRCNSSEPPSTVSRLASVRRIT